LTLARNSFEVPVTAYAVAGDFCRIFAKDMNGLYLLSFLLTADPVKAEQCFVSGFADCIESTRVFREWAPSWTRRTIIQSAIRMMKPSPERTGHWTAPAADGLDATDRSVPLAALLGLKTFDRFVFVMSILERFSDQDCKALLGASRQDIIRARARAFERIGKSKGGLFRPAFATPKNSQLTVDLAGLRSS